MKLLEELVKRMHQTAQDVGQEVGRTAQQVGNNIVNTPGIHQAAIRDVRRAVPQIPAVRKQVESYSKPIENQVGQGFDQIFGWNPQMQGMKMGVQGIVDTPASFLRGAEYLTSPQRRAEVGRADFMTQMETGGDVFNLLPMGRVTSPFVKAGAKVLPKVAKVVGNVPTPKVHINAPKLTNANFDQRLAKFTSDEPLSTPKNSQTMRSQAETILSKQPSQSQQIVAQRLGLGDASPTQKQLTPQRPKDPLESTQQGGEQTETLLQKTETARQRYTLEDRPNPSGSLEDIISRHSTDVKNKVGLFDFVRTPDRVLKKIGLEKESDLIRKSYDSYLDELPKNIDKITEWSKQVSPESNQRIFQYLDGKPIDLAPNELKVANEIKVDLANWADRLKLPQDRRISNYITHVFDEDLVNKEFPDEIAKIIQDQIPGSVYDPFVLQRLGKLGYKEDVWQALDAYVKRATRKVHMDPALEQTKRAAEHLELSQFNYVKKYIDRVNMRPTDLDNLLDNTIKQGFGYRFGGRPTANLTGKLRRMVYRGTLGLNVGSAVRNLTQGANTYSRLGEKFTLIGYTKAVKNMVTKGDELERVGVLRDNFVQDRTLNATKKFWEKFDKGLFVFFDAAERINRGAAYFGAKSKGLAKGMNEEQAIEFAKKVVRDTQFTFGSIDTPPLLQGDIAKTLLQFQSFNVKQAEFLSEMVKSKDFAGMIRFSLASLAMVYSVGKVLGLEPKDIIPFSGVATGETKLGQTPPVKLAGDLIGAATGSKDEYGGEQDMGDRIRTIGKDLVPFIPAGVQGKKTLEGIGAYNEGASTTASGRTRFEVEQTPGNFAKAATLGQFSLPGAQEYFSNMGKSGSQVIYEQFKGKSPQEKAALWQQLVKEKKITKDNVSDVTKWFNDEKLGISDKERKMRNLGVEDQSRARTIAKEFNGKSPQQKKELWQKYVKAKIITKEVAKQLVPMLEKR